MRVSWAAFGIFGMACGIAGHAAGESWATLVSGFEGAVEGTIDRQVHRKDFNLRVYRNETNQPLGVVFVEYLNFQENIHQEASIDLGLAEFQIFSRVTEDYNYYSYHGKTYNDIPTEEDLNAVKIIDYQQFMLPHGKKIPIPNTVVAKVGDLETRDSPVFRVEFTEPVSYRIGLQSSLGEEYTRASMFMRSIDPVTNEQRAIVYHESYSPGDGYYEETVKIGDEVFTYPLWYPENPHTDWNLALASAIEGSALIAGAEGRTSQEPAFFGVLPAGVYEFGTTGKPGCDGNTCGPVVATLDFEATPIPEPGVAGWLVAFAVGARQRRAKTTRRLCGAHFPA